MKKRKIWIACIAALVIAAAFMPVSALTATPAFAADKAQGSATLQKTGKSVAEASIKRKAPTKAKTYTVAKGVSVKFKAKASGKVKYKSSNKKVLTINKKTGKAKAKKTGRAKITATCGGKKVVWNVTVVKGIKKIQRKSPAGAEFSMNIGGTKQLSVKQTPAKLKKAALKVTYASSKPSVAKVDPNKGRVTAVHAGKAKITATNVASGKKVSWNVTVSAAKVTREQVVVMAAGMLGLQPPEEANIQYSFTDVKDADQPGLIEAAYRYGLVPESPLKFRPKEAASREFTAYVFTKAAGYEPIEENAVSAECADKNDLQYTYEDQVAMEFGVFDTVSQDFRPDQEVTTKEFERLKLTLTETLAEPDLGEGVRTSYELADGVEEVTADYTIGEQGDRLILSKLSDVGLFRKGHTYLVTQRSDENQKIAIRAKTVDYSLPGGYVLFETPSMKEVLKSAQVIGSQTEGEAEFIPEEGVTFTTGGGNYKKGASASGSCSLGKEINVSLDKGKINALMEAFGCSSKLEQSLDFTFSIDRLDYDVDCGWSGIKKMYLAADIQEKLKYSAKYENTFIDDDISAVEGVVAFPIGKFMVTLPYGFTVDYEIIARLDVSGSIELTAVAGQTVGIEMVGDHLRKIAETTKREITFNMDGKVRIGPEFDLTLKFAEVIDLVSMGAYVGPGMTFHADRTFYVGEPDIYCVDAKMFLFLDLWFEGDILESFDPWGRDFKKEFTIFDENNSPLRLLMHFEETGPKDFCTRQDMQVAPPAEPTDGDIIYNGNGATSGSMEPTTLKNGSGKLSKNRFQKTGDTFWGWSTDPNATSITYADGAAINVKGKITLYAIWKSKVRGTIVYNGNGSTSGSMSSQSYTNA
ncbi:MAG: Ig-like domain-containing protein [Firmicutes bacterium]|nr:Ig-like domain-containing protein [Bacillota bacterium]